jgi:hypothetical protein
MKAVHISETLVYSNENTWRYVPEDSKLHTRRHENLKSHEVTCLWSAWSDTGANSLRCDAMSFTPTLA